MANTRLRTIAVALCVLACFGLQSSTASALQADTSSEEPQAEQPALPVEALNPLAVVTGDGYGVTVTAETIQPGVPVIAPLRNIASICTGIAGSDLSLVGLVGADIADCPTVHCTYNNWYGSEAAARGQFPPELPPNIGLDVPTAAEGPHYLTQTSCRANVTLADGTNTTVYLRNPASVPGFTGQLHFPSWARVADAISDLPGTLARLRAAADVIIGTPEVAMKPLPDHTYVQFPGWLWIEGTTDPVAVEAFDTAGATIRIQMWATPQQATFTPGDSKPAFDCEMDELIEPPAGLSGSAVFDAECTHTYTQAGSYTTTATVEWAYTYQIALQIAPFAWDTGPVTTLPNPGVFTTPPQAVAVFEIQAVNGS